MVRLHRLIPRSSPSWPGRGRTGSPGGSFALIASLPTIMLNVDPAELAKFSALAHRWWDPASDFKPLHDINPLRLGYLSERCGGLAGKRAVDVGCGGGILTEAMARQGAIVTGIDLSETALSVARLQLLVSALAAGHRLKSGAA